MASKALELFIRAKDGASQAFNSVGDSMTSMKARGEAAFAATRTAAEKFQTKIQDLKKLLAAGTIDGDVFSRASAKAKAEMAKEERGPEGNPIDKLIGGAKTLAIIGAVSKGLSVVRAAVVGYKDALREGYGEQYAFKKSLEDIVHSIPIASQVFDIGNRLLGNATTDDWVKQRNIIMELSKSYNQLGLEVNTARRNIKVGALGTSDDAKFSAANINQWDADLAAIKERENALEEYRLRNKQLMKDLGGESLNTFTNYIEAQSSLLAEQKELAGKAAATRASQYKNQQQEDRIDRRVASEIKVSQMTGSIRQQMLKDYRQDLQAELNLIEQNTNEKLKLLKIAYDKARANKPQADQDEMRINVGHEANAIKKQAEIDKAQAYRDDLRRQREKNIAERDKRDADERKSEDNAGKFRSILVSGLEQQAALGDGIARVEVERLKITEEMIAKRRELNDIIKDDDASYVDRNKAKATLEYLKGEEKRRKAFLGVATSFQGSTAQANTSYFGSGVAEASRERTWVSPLIAEQKKANEKLSAQLAALDKLPDNIANKLKDLGNFIVGVIK